MFALGETDHYYLFSSPCDMRKGFDTLCGVVRALMNRDPLSGEVFIFLNRGGRTLKLLHWEHGGFVIYYKRLESGQFSRPAFDQKSNSYRLKWMELVMMIDGISLEKVVYKKRYERPTETA
jgi:transposase